MRQHPSNQLEEIQQLITEMDMQPAEKNTLLKSTLPPSRTVNAVILQESVRLAALFSVLNNLIM